MRVVEWIRPCSCLKQPSVNPDQVVSSGIVFTRCSDCGGWGKDLVNSTGKCDFCERRGVLVQPKSGSDRSQSVHQTTPLSQTISTPVVPSSLANPSSQIHSRASEVYGMQPQLRMYKKRPGFLNLLLS